MYSTENWTEIKTKGNKTWDKWPLDPISNA